MRTRYLAMLLLILALPLALGCGGDGDDGDGFLAAILPLPGFEFHPLPVGNTASFHLGAVNYSGFPATVTWTHYSPVGAMVGMTTQTLDAFEEKRAPFAPGGIGGFIVAAKAGAGASYVATYSQRDIPGESDTAPGIHAFSGKLQVSTDARTNKVQLSNYGMHMGTPTSMTYMVYIRDHQGVATSTTTTTVPANGCMEWAVDPNTVGSVDATPISRGGGLPITGDTNVAGVMNGYLQDLQVTVEVRFITLDDSFFERIGIDFDFGTDEDGNVNDFGLAVVNRSATDKTAIVSAVRDEAGNNLLQAPRAVTLPGYGSRFLGTTNARSDGLDINEVSPFADILGDVGAQQTVTSYQVELLLDTEVSARGLQYDSIFNEFRKVRKATPISRNIHVANLPIQETLPSGTRNYVVFRNPLTTPQSVFVRGYTPGGQEYILDSFTVPGSSRIEWSPDGRRFTEVPFDQVGAAVPYMQFRFTPSGTLYVSGRTEVRDAQNTLLICRPLFVDGLDS